MSLAGRRAPVAFLDRDGTLIEDVGYPRDPGDVRPLPGALEALGELREHGFRLAVVSNQSGIGRGLVTPEQARAVHERFVEVLGAAGVVLDCVEYCPHAPWEGCDCRKPGIAMLERAAAALGAAPERSFMAGDKLSDVEAGRRMGLRTVLLDPSGALDPAADHVVADWAGVLNAVLAPRASR